MEDPALDRFALVGDTALALKIGHRKSIDPDLFTSDDFNQSVLSEHIGPSMGFPRVLSRKPHLFADGNIAFYPNPPGMPDMKIIALSVMSEALT